jgi:hypothetical protein
MKAYGRKNPIMDGSRKNKKHSRRGNVCPVCNNTKINKKSARQIAKREIRCYLLAA